MNIKSLLLSGLIITGSVFGGAAEARINCDNPTHPDAIAACEMAGLGNGPSQQEMDFMMGIVGHSAEMEAQNQCAYAPNPQGCLRIKRQQNQKGLGLMNGLFNGSITTEQDLIDHMF